MTMFSYFYFLLFFQLRQLYPSVTSEHAAITGAPNDGFFLNTLKTLLRLSRVLLDLWKCILSGAKKFVSVRSS